MKKILYILSVVFAAVSMTSCSQDIEADDNMGYLSLDINSLTSTHETGSRVAAPEGYAAKTLHVEIQDAAGTVVKSTDDFANDDEFQGNIELKGGKYTIVAHSAAWDGSGSGFDVPYYYGSTTVTVVAKSLVKANVVCTQANVKITVNYAADFANNFKAGATIVTPASADVEPLAFVMNETTQAGYIPVGDFDIELSLVNQSDVVNTLTRSFTNVEARDHYILNFKLADEGTLGDGTSGGVKVEVDESTNTIIYNFEVPRKSSIALVTRAANAWSKFAMLSGAITAKTDDFNYSGLSIQWRKQGDTEWFEIPYGEFTVDSDDNVSATLQNLSPLANYEYRLRYVNGDDEVSSDVVSFTTEEEVALYNGGFENWWLDGKIAYANEEGTTYWDTSNAGAASFGGSNTTQETSVVHGGTSSAKLESKYIVIKFAAASLYTGTFDHLVGTNGAVLNWGVPFTSRPTALKGYMQYSPVAINRAGKNLPADAPAKGETDLCGMYCVLLSEALQVDNTDMSTFPDWENDSRVIAYGSLPLEQNVHSNGEWKEVNIPFTYYNLTKKPTHLLVVFSASKYGDYFHGGEGSTLYLDDFSLEYGTQVTVK